MDFPFGLKELSPSDLVTYRRRYEDSVASQPVDGLAQWYLKTYESVQPGEFTEALNRLDMVLAKSSDYSAFVAAKHLLSQVSPGSPVGYQVTRRLLANGSPLLFRYGLCLVIAGDSMVDREISEAITRLSSVDEETMRLTQVAKIAIQSGAARRV